MNENLGYLEDTNFGGLEMDYNDAEADNFAQNMEYASCIPLIANTKIDNLKNYFMGIGIPTILIVTLILVVAVFAIISCIKCCRARIIASCTDRSPHVSEISSFMFELI